MEFVEEIVCHLRSMITISEILCKRNKEGTTNEGMKACYVHTMIPVSYTHLDVYKRQSQNIASKIQLRLTRY